MIWDEYIRSGGQIDPANPPVTTSTRASSKRWAEDYARQNPGWQGNETWRMENGEAKDTRSWLARNGWIIPLLVGSGVGTSALLGGGAAGAAGVGSGAGATGGGGAGTLASTGFAAGAPLPGYLGGTAAATTGPVGAAGGAGDGGMMDIVKTGLAGLLGVRSLVGGSGGRSGDYANLLKQIPGLQENLDLQTAQARRNEPLHAAMVQLAMNLLPRSAFANYGRPSVGTPQRAPSRSLPDDRERAVPRGY